MPDFVTTFTPPDPVEGLTIEADLVESVVRVSWDPTIIAEVDFGGYRVYRDTGDGFVLLELLTGVNDVAFSDYTAPLNTSLAYRVTQSNLDFESEGADGTVSLDTSAWWAVTPGDPSLTFAITKIRGATLTSPKVQELFSPIGRPTRIAVGDVVQTEEGELSFLAMPDNPGMIGLLKRVQAKMDGSLLLKAPDGVVHEVQYGSITRSFTNVPGLQELTLPFAGV